MLVPRLIVNLKSYVESSGERAVEIARTAESIQRETGVPIAIAPNLIDLARVAEKAEIMVLAQHVDPVKPGAATGSVPPELVKSVGASGSLLNHSEKPLKLSHIAESVGILKNLDMIQVVCAPTPDQVAAVSALSPTAVAVEPPELIGTGISVSKAKPEVILDSLRAIVDTNPDVVLLCGAGITNGEDVESALRLGSYGVLVASAVAKSPDPGKKMRELVEPFKRVIRA